MTIPDDILAKICSGAAERLFQHLHQCQRYVGRNYESPIEEVFATAVHAHWSRFVDGVFSAKVPVSTLDAFVSELQERGRTECFSALMAPQVAIDKYRVDFLFGAMHDGRERPALYAVECDGHDFHEKTKEQAIRDKARDRALLAIGVKTVRFTGAEIWGDPMRCVDELMDLIVRESEQAHEEWFKGLAV